MVWNYCNELSFTHTQRTGKFFSSYDLQNYTKGATKEGLKLNAATVQMVGACLLYTSDAADERSSVDLGGRRILKKKK